MNKRTFIIVYIMLYRKRMMQQAWIRRKRVLKVPCNRQTPHALMNCFEALHNAGRRPAKNTTSLFFSSLFPPLFIVFIFAPPYF